MQMNKICRVCSCRGDYSIFTPIPSYLHSSPNEFLHWKKDISTLLEETTGLVISPDDGLPDKMCALCISYLKHAATFRQQLIENTLSLKVAQKLLTTTKTKNDENFTSTIFDADKSKKDNIPPFIVNDDDNGECDLKAQVTEEDLNFKTTRKTDTVDFLNNVLNNPKKLNEYEKKAQIIIKNSTTEESVLNDNNNDDNLNTMILNLLFDKENGSDRTRRFSRRNNFKNSKSQILNRNYSIDDDYDENDEFQNNSSSCEDEYFAQKNSTIVATEATAAAAAKATENTNNHNNGKSNMFDYEEKIFEEDDIMNLVELKNANITINIPEELKERKCRACYRRFMTEDSLIEHQNLCIELKLLQLIEEINSLLNIRRSKTISPHEYIRRTIFSLKKTYQWLNTFDQTIEKLNENTNNSNSNNGNNQKTIATSSSPNDVNKNESTFSKDTTTTMNTQKLSTLNNDQNKNLTDLEKTTKGAVSKICNDKKVHKINNRVESYQALDKNVTTTPTVASTKDDDSNLLLQLLIKNINNDENSKTDNNTRSRNSSPLLSSTLLNNFSHKKSPIMNLNSQYNFDDDNMGISPIKKEIITTTTTAKTTINTATTSTISIIPTSSINNSFSYSNFSINPTPSSLSSSPIIPCIKMNFSAVCNECDIIFNSIGSLEQHNLNYHNKTKKMSTSSNSNPIIEPNEHHKNIIDLFEENPNGIEGTVDLMNILSLEDAVNKISSSRSAD